MVVIRVRFAGQVGPPATVNVVRITFGFFVGAASSLVISTTPGASCARRAAGNSCTSI